MTSFKFLLSLFKPKKTSSKSWDIKNPVPQKESFTNLRLMELNAQDLFISLAYPVQPHDLTGLSEEQWQLLGDGDVPQKPLHKLFGLQELFLKERPDVAMICEVGGMKSLEAFNSLFLNDSYLPLMSEGDSERGIECCFLVKKGIGLESSVVGHHNIQVKYKYEFEELGKNSGKDSLVVPFSKRRMSRSVQELSLYGSKSDSKSPLLVILMVHLKSGFDPDQIDEKGRRRRGAEVASLIKLKKSVERKFGDNVPVIIAGDFNGDASLESHDPEFSPMYRDNNMRDVLKLASRPKFDRITHFTFIESKIQTNQLDYIFLPPSLYESFLSEKTYVHKWCYAGSFEEMQPPSSLRERNELPSDHYPLICELRLKAKI